MLCFYKTDSSVAGWDPLPVSLMIAAANEASTPGMMTMPWSAYPRRPGSSTPSRISKLMMIWAKT
ncbi:hypothetical protein D3C74_471920 [compost metagenome]